MQNFKFITALQTSLIRNKLVLKFKQDSPIADKVRAILAFSRYKVLTHVLCMCGMLIRPRPTC